MFDIILYQPEIPPNTGNIIRVCANTGCRLHLIQPLGFHMDDKSLARAGMDYRELAVVEQHRNLEDCYKNIKPDRVFAVSTRGQSIYSEIDYQPDDCFVFGPETRGLPEQVLSTIAPDRILRIPMLEHSRSLNLANSVSILVYEGWRQNKFRQIPT